LETMATTPLNTIKNWFKTNLYPTQAQFWATWDSFWHKDESIPQEKIEGLQDALDDKVDIEALHVVAITGDYNDLENIPPKQKQRNIYKAAGNTEDHVQIGDRCVGFIAGNMVYDSICVVDDGNEDDLATWNIIAAQNIDI